MGMFDVIHFPQLVTCTNCQAQITSTQTKAFEPLQKEFYIGDCVGHAEEIGIVREPLYCDTCRVFDKQFIYLIVYRGILVDVAVDLATAEAQLRNFSFERLILWYHDLSAKRDDERCARQAFTGFLHDILRWYEGKYDKMSPEEREKKPLFFLQNSAILEKADDPLVAIRAYLAEIEQHGADVD